MKNPLKRLSAAVASAAILFSLWPAQLVMANPSTAPEDLIDYSHSPLAGYGYTFGVTGNEMRWQTFTASRDGNLESAEVVLYKKNAQTVATPDVTAHLYTVENNLPKDKLASATLPGDQINSAVKSSEVLDNMISKFPLTYALTAGTRYAIALESAVVGTDGGVDQCYDWFAKKDIAPEENFGKTNGAAWVDESGLGTAWLRLTYEPAAADVIDYSYTTTANGYGFGATGNEYRFQTFTATKSGEMGSVDIKVTKFAHDAQSLIDQIGDLRVELRSVGANNMPDQKLAETVVPAADIVSKEIKTVPLSYSLEAGTRYAIAMIMEGTLSSHGGFDCYGWPAANNAAVTGEFYGKTNTTSDPSYAGPNYNWVHEGLGTGWLRVNYQKEVKPSVVTSISYEVAKKSLALNEETTYTYEVKDQYGEVMAGETADVTSSDTEVVEVNAAEQKLIGKKGGTSKITFTNGSVTASVTVSVKNDDGTVIPTPGMVITEDTKLAPGEYDFGGAAKGIVIQGDGITLDGNGAKIYNAPESAILADVTSGAYAYKLNYMDGHSQYNITRKLNLTGTDIDFSFDYKGATDSNHKLRVLASENGTDWATLLDNAESSPTEWKEAEVDLNAYSGKEVQLRISYEVAAKDGSEAMLLDTIELFEDGVRTFSDLAEAKVFYWWDTSYEDGARVADSLANKPFDRTTYSISPSLYKGTGIEIAGTNNVTVKNIDLSGFYWAVDAKNSTALTLDGNKLSNNRTDPNVGWGDQEGGAVQLNNVSGSTIKNNVANNNSNGLVLRSSNNNTITNNDFSINSDVCLEMHSSSFNEIVDNDFSWGIRIDAGSEVHARDSTSQLMESGSNYNRFTRNDFTHGGDGIFIRVLNGYSCEGNLFEYNDTSFANNNAVESWAGRNYYYFNKANYSSYGFWMGGSDESVLVGNEMAYNGIMPRNAYEGQSGNCGLAYIHGTGDHVKIIGNKIHDNGGPGIGMSFQPSKNNGNPYYKIHNVLIANNDIYGNKKVAGASGNSMFFSFTDWVDISNNNIHDNQNNDIYLDQTSVDSGIKSKVTNVFIHGSQDGSEYYADLDDFYAHQPKAAISTDKTVYVAGEEITFTAADQEAGYLGGSNLFYRWDMGNGISTGDVQVGKSVKFSYDKPGQYDVAYTVTNGIETNLAWLNVTVVAPGEEIGTESDVSGWLIPDQGGKLKAATETQREYAPAQWQDFKTWQVVDGDKSIRINTTSGTNSLTYPATKDGSFNFSDFNSLAFNLKVQNANQEWSANQPVVKLYNDKNNYVSYQASKSWLLPVFATNYGKNQMRHDWQGHVVPFDGNTEWTKTAVGTVDMSNIKYIEFLFPTGTAGMNLWLDGVKGFNFGQTSVNMAPDAAITASSTEEGDAKNPVKNMNTTDVWVPKAGEPAVYELDFGTERYMNSAEVYLWYEPSMTPENDKNIIPSAYTLEYYNGKVWRPVKQAAPAQLRANLNAIDFDTVNAQKLRFTFENQPGKSLAMYGIKVLNKANYAGASDSSGNRSTEIVTSISKDVVLDSVEMILAVNNEGLWDEPGLYGDFEAYIYKASADGKGPTGAPLAKGVVRKADISKADLGKPRTITMRDSADKQITLTPETRYVLLATQNPRTIHIEGDDRSNLHYRWATSNATGIVGEQYGKVNSTDLSNITSFGSENLGTGWLKIHTNMDMDGKATIDYSWATSPIKNGYGLGHQGEENRYQTFTVPANSVVDVIDGLVNNSKAWNSNGAAEKTNSVTMTLQKPAEIGLVNINFGAGHVAAKAVVSVDGTKVAEADKLTAGFNAISFDAVTGSKIEIAFTDGDSYTAVSEIEVMKSAVDSKAPTQAELKDLYDGFMQESRQEADYTPASLKAYNDALAAAKTVIDKASATPAELQTAFDNLYKAHAALAPRANTAELKTAVADAAAVDGAKYTADSYNAFTIALKEAQAVLADANATQAQVTAALQKIATAKAALVSKASDVTSIQLSKTELTLEAGKTGSITATVQPADAADKTVTWASSNTAVATVNGGSITAVKPGTATITVKSADGKVSASCKVTVIRNATGVKMSMAVKYLKVNKTVQLKATVEPSDTTNKTVTWKSSNTKVATVTSKGKVTAKKIGTATITARTANGKTAKVTIKVTKDAVSVSKVALSPKAATLKKGKSLVVKATVSPANASYKKLKWETSDKKVATVSSSGKVVARGKGKAVITVTSLETGKTAKITITVK